MKTQTIDTYIFAESTSWYYRNLRIIRQQQEELTQNKKMHLQAEVDKFNAGEK